MIYTQYLPHYSPEFQQFRRIFGGRYKKYRSPPTPAQPLYHGKSRQMASGNICV
ncbi:hypothetical protein CKO_04026 [Citrobacter koseri ATCC BAA-895]|uniref:Uncharacterized protein n=1 Tax=Citrobacter koseri (strain ATCC BAA-895 / CDC 4225-83 / SGSC4696) TaxID=290338 RepID=A8ANN5_CITK8|nr:hypothetical protein CKO_04026 [Citrobacter koseri ATCC BAA-895]